MNRQTRRLSKIPEEVKQELVPFYLNRLAVPTEEVDCERIDKLTDDTAERIRSGLAVSFISLFIINHHFSFGQTLLSQNYYFLKIIVLSPSLFM